MCERVPDRVSSSRPAENIPVLQHPVAPIVHAEDALAFIQRPPRLVLPQLSCAPLQSAVCPGGAAGPAAAAVAGPAALCGSELRSAARLLHPADAPAGC